MRINLNVPSCILFPTSVLVAATFLSPMAYAQSESAEPAPAGSIKSSPIPEPSVSSTTQWPVEMSGSFTVEAAGIAADGAASTFGNSYVFKPTFAIAPWDLSASLQVSYNQSLTSSNDTNDLPPGSFDNHVISVVKSFDAISLGVVGAIPANQTSRDLTFIGSAGPFAKIEKRYRRLGLAQSAIYQHRFYEYDINPDESVNLAEAAKSLSEITYDLGDGFAVASSALLTFGLGTEMGYGIRSQMTVDYKPFEKFTTTLGVALERGISSLEGVAGKTDQAQAFLDLVVDL